MPVNRIISRLLASCKRLLIDCLINMPDETAPSLDDLADEAFKFGKRGQATAFASKLVEMAFNDRDSTRLQARDATL
jgi:hypothetical protein